MAAFLEQQDRGESGRQPCLRHRLTIETVDLSGVRVDVRAVDAEGGECAWDVERVVDVREARTEPLDLRLEGRPRLLELRLECDLREVALFARELAIERCQRLPRPRIDEQRRHVVYELVAGRPLDGPVAQLLAGLEDLLDPDVLDARLTQPLQVPRRIREAVGMIDADPVDHALVHQFEHLCVCRLEHLGILDPHSGEIPDVEEPPHGTGSPLDVEELGTGERLAPERVLLFARRHVVGHDVEDHPEAGPAESPELLLAAELLRQPCRVDDVVAVRRARARLQRGSEVQMAGAEVAQVRNELSCACEVEVREQLKPVRAAELRHRAAVPVFGGA